jgi:hypothetical protein
MPSWNVEMPAAPIWYVRRQTRAPAGWPTAAEAGVGSGGGPGRSREGILLSFVAGGGEARVEGVCAETGPGRAILERLLMPRCVS